MPDPPRPLSSVPSAPSSPEPALSLWTVGHSTRSIEAFLEVLRAHRIGVLADVRHFPKSRRHPQFSQEHLQPALARAGITYAHLVDLGGFRKGGYEAHMATPQWNAGFAKLEALVRSGARVAVCCAERVPDGCHRRFIAAHAASLGWRVTHILDAERTAHERPPAARQARLDEEHGPHGHGPSP